MNILYTPKEFEKAKIRSKLPLSCLYCHNTFYANKYRIQKVLSKTEKKRSLDFCNHKCFDDYKKQTTVTVRCETCNKEITKTASRLEKIKRHHYCSMKCRVINPPIEVKCEQCGKKIFRRPRLKKRHFCSKSCSSTWGNTHRTVGCTRSKLEKWIEEQLKLLYPNLDIHYNRRDAIDSELDIYIPSLKLAFELNGIYHYEPIFGEEKLATKQNIDQRKMQVCIERKISLCVIDTSTFTYYKAKGAEKYLDIITKIINQQLQ